MRDTFEPVGREQRKELKGGEMGPGGGWPCAKGAGGRFRTLIWSDTSEAAGYGTPEVGQPADGSRLPWVGLDWMTSQGGRACLPLCCKNNPDYSPTGAFIRSASLIIRVSSPRCKARFQSGLASSHMFKCDYFDTSVCVRWTWFACSKSAQK